MFYEDLDKMQEYFKMQRLLGTYGHDEFEVDSGTGQIILKSLTKVGIDGLYIVPDFVDVIEYGAISNAVGLKHLIVGGNVTHIQKSGLSHNEFLETVELREGIEYIGEYAFLGDSKLKEIILPDSVKTIEDDIAFRCASLRKFIMTNSLESCGQQRFYNSEYLEYIQIPMKFSSKILVGNSEPKIKYI